MKLGGAGYLLYLSYSHFFRHEHGEDRRAVPRAKSWLGMSPFWATVVRVELVNIAFSIDSILVAVAMSNSFWVILTGGLLGVAAMRAVVTQLVRLIQRYPGLVDGAFVIIIWVAVKLLLDYARQLEWIGWEISQTVSLAIVVGIFIVSLLIARRRATDPGYARS